MSQIKLEDPLSLYVIPTKTQDPAIQSIPTLRKVAKLAGGSFPIVRTRGYLTDVALPEADGDLHFFIETTKNAHLHQSPMQTCEIQGLFKLGANKKSSDPRLKRFKQLFEVGGLAGLNIAALTATTPAWVTQLAPVLSLKKRGH